MDSVPVLAERLETVRTLATENLEELFLGLSLESRAPIGFLNGLEKANDRTICMRAIILCYCVTLEATPRVESTMILIFEGVVVRSLTGFHFVLYLKCICRALLLCASWLG